MIAAVSLVATPTVNDREYINKEFQIVIAFPFEGILFLGN
jgi:hypothetical protein